MEIEKFMKEFTLERLEDVRYNVDNGEMIYVDDLHHELYIPPTLLVTQKMRKSNW